MCRLEFALPEPFGENCCSRVVWRNKTNLKYNYTKEFIRYTYGIGSRRITMLVCGLGGTVQSGCLYAGSRSGTKMKVWMLNVELPVRVSVGRSNSLCGKVEEHVLKAQETGDLHS